MTHTPIANYWREIERLSPDLTDEQHATLRGIYFAGAMAAVHELTGWDPDAGVQVLALDHRSLTLLIRELADACCEPIIELYAEMVRH